MEVSHVVDLHPSRHTVDMRMCLSMWSCVPVHILSSHPGPARALRADMFEIFLSTGCCDEAEWITGIVWCKLLCRVWAPVNLLTRAQCHWNAAVPLLEQKLLCRYSFAPPGGPSLLLTTTWGLSLCHFPSCNLNMTEWWWSHAFWETRVQICIYQVLGWHLLLKSYLYCYRS